MPTKKIVKPEFNKEIIVTLPVIEKITYNVNEVKEFAIELKNYYSTVTFTDEEIKEAAKERAKLNSFKKNVTDFRKKKVDEAKEKLGIAEFESICKETEKLIDETSNFVDVQVKAFQEKEWNEKKVEIEKLIKEKTEINITWNDKWKNKTCDLNEIISDIDAQIEIYDKDQEQLNKDIDVIKRMTTDEKYIERYKHTRDLTSVLNDIDADKKVTVVVPETMEVKVTTEEVKMVCSYTFIGTKEQIEMLKKYAKEELWMEVD